MNIKKMVKHCQWGTCNGDFRYPASIKGGKLLSFPNPKTKQTHAMAWIKACRRPNYQLNIENLNCNKAVCSGHFIGGNGPSPQHPYPVPADGSQVHGNIKGRKHINVAVASNEEVDKSVLNSNIEETITEDVLSGISTQTDEPSFALVKSTAKQSLDFAPCQMGTNVGDLHSSQNDTEQEHIKPLEVINNSPCSDEGRIDVHEGKESEDEPIDIDSIKKIFGWETVDNTDIPFLLRKKRKFVSVRIVECKLLSQYPNTFPDELGKKDPLVSYFITEAEANLLNEINTTHCVYEYGHDPFTVKDLIVDLEDFEEFLKLVKKTFPSDVLATIGEESTSPCKSSQVSTKLSHFCGWIQINNTVSPYILRQENGKQIKLVPLSVIVYAAGLLTNSTVQGVLPTPQECALLNEACRVAGFDFLFGKFTRLVSISEVLERCQVQLFELPFEYPLQHARYLESCAGQPSSSPLMAVMSNPLKTIAPTEFQPLPKSKPSHGVMNLVSKSTADSSFFVSGFPRSTFQPSQPAVPNSLNSGLAGFRETTSPAKYVLPGIQTGISLESSYFPQSQIILDKSLDNITSAKHEFPKSLWNINPLAPPPAHVKYSPNSLMSKTPPITPDPPNSWAYQFQSLLTNPLIYSKNMSPLLSLSAQIFQDTMHKPLGTQYLYKDLPAAIVKYPPPVTGLPLPPTQFSNLSPFSFEVKELDSSPLTRTDKNWLNLARSTHHLISQASAQNPGNETLQSLIIQPAGSINLNLTDAINPHSKSKDNSHSEDKANPHLAKKINPDLVNKFYPGNINIHSTNDMQPKSKVSIPNLDRSQQNFQKVKFADSSKDHIKPDSSHTISTCIINSKSISCISVNLPDRKGAFCLVEAVSKLYFQSASLTEFIKVLQVVLKINLYDCTPQEEAAFIQYYNLPVNKLKCNKIISVSDLETYFPQINYIFSKHSPDLNQGQQAVSSHKHKLNSPPPGPAAKVTSTNLGTHQTRDNTTQNKELTLQTSTNVDAPVVVIDDE